MSGIPGLASEADIPQGSWLPRSSKVWPVASCLSRLTCLPNLPDSRRERGWSPGKLLEMSDSRGCSTEL